jgi:tellurite resistance protein TerC
MIFDWVIVIVQLIFLEGFLSIDNAAVLGAMVATLPPDEAIPWPSFLSSLGQKLDPLLGNQQDAALKVGLLGAYVGRAAMLAAAHLVIQYSWLRLLGGVYLVYMAADHLSTAHDLAHDSEGPTHPLDANGKGFWQVVLAVELMDLAFSLDNVVAAVALSSHMAVVMLGVALGILTMRFAAGFFARLISRQPILEPAAYVLVLVIGLRFIVSEVFRVEIPTAVEFGLSALVVVTALLYAHYPSLQVMQPFFAGCQRAMRLCLNLFQLVVTKPLGQLISLLASALRLN